MSLAKKLFRGTSLSVLDHVVKSVALFVTTPLIVRGLGQEGYGQWLLGMSILGYLLMLDLGMSLGVSRFLSTSIGAKDLERQAAVLAVSQRFYRRVGAIVAAGSLIAGPLTVFILGWNAHSWELMITVAICGMTLALKFRYRLPGLMLRSHVRYDLLSIASIVRVAVQACAVSFAMWHQSSVLAVGLIQACSDLLELGMQSWWSRDLRSQIRPVMASLNTGLFNELKQRVSAYSRDSMLSSLGDTLRYQIGSVVLGSIRGASEVAVYSTGLRLIMMYVDFNLAAFGGGMLMVFGQMHGAGDEEGTLNQFRRLTKIAAGFAGWAMGGIVLLGQPFLHRWLGTGFDDSFHTLLILALPFAFLAMQFPAYNLLSAKGHQRYLMWISCIGGICTTLCSIPAGMIGGVHGIAYVLGTEILLTVVIFIPWLLKKCLGIQPLSYFTGTVLLPAMKALVLPVLVAWFMRGWRVPDYGALFVVGCAYTLAFILPSPWLLLDAAGRQTLRRAIGR